MHYASLAALLKAADDLIHIVPVPFHATTEQETIYTKPLIINAIIGRITVKIFINSDCQSNYISPTFLRKTKIP